MYKEHKKLYKAGKKWLAATITVTAVTLMGAIQTAHADSNETNVESSTQAVTMGSNKQDNQQTVILTTPENNNDQTSNGTSTSTTPTVTVAKPSETGGTATATNPQNEQQVSQNDDSSAKTSSDELDPNIYGTVNVKDWDYQNDSNIFNLTGYHGQDTRHIIVPNLNDFDNAGVKIGNANEVGLTSTLTKKLASRSVAFAISKTSGKYSDKVTATDNNWSGVFESTGLIDADISNLDTHNITDMSSLFSCSNKLKTIGDLSQWDTSNVTNMASMFNLCKFIPGNIGQWNTGNVTNMYNMFGDYDGIIGDLSHWNTSNVTDMSMMFSSSKSSGTIGDLSYWNTSNVTDMSMMFLGSSVSASGLTNWDTSHVTDMSSMLNATSLPYKIVTS